MVLPYLTVDIARARSLVPAESWPDRGGGDTSGGPVGPNCLRSRLDLRPAVLLVGGTGLREATRAQPAAPRRSANAAAMAMLLVMGGGPFGLGVLSW
jgi:hypothetical protein